MQTQGVLAPAAVGRMTVTTMEGQFDTLRGDYSRPLIYHRMYIGDVVNGEESSIYFGNSRCFSVYIYDTRIANGATPQEYDNAFSLVYDAFPLLLQNRREAEQRMIMWPNGDERPGTTVPHVTGGAYAINRIVFFVNRCSRTGTNFLLCHVY